MDAQPGRRAPAVALLATTGAILVILAAGRPRLAGSITTWRGDDLAFATAWTLATACAAWLGVTALACLVASTAGRRASAHRIAGWAPPVARRILQTALISGWALVPTYAYAAAPRAPLTVRVGPAGRLVEVPPTGAVIDIPVVRAPSAGPAADHPEPAPATPARPAPRPGPHPPAAARAHVVRAGDNLWRIARAELTTARAGAPVGEGAVADYWQRVVTANRATLRSGDPSLIFPGEVVTLPLP